MCGIAGFAGIGDQADLAAMTGALAHRGPDGDGLFSDREAGVHLGHTRLAIVDLAGGGQPMWNADRSIGVVFKGSSKPGTLIASAKPTIACCSGVGSAW